MLQNWLKPLPKDLLNSISALPAQSFGAGVATHDQALPDLKKVKVALIGLDEKEANQTREALYRSAWAFPKGSVADLGNMRKADAAQLIPVLYELLSGNILPVLIARRHESARAQFLAYQEAKALVNLAIVDERCRFSRHKDDGNAYADLLSPRHPALFHAAMIGLQAHQFPPDMIDWLERQHIETVRLGRSRASMEETEPVLRDADLLCFHLSALKQSEAPGVADASPSGYFLEEACQLCRYAGMSDKLTSFGIFGLEAERDRDRQTTQATAQLVWYFLDGFFNRKKDYPASKDGLTEYIVEFPAYNYQLTFWKSVKSGRWWIQAPVDVKRKQQRHRLIPCSFQDYQAACRQELPERLIQAFKRFE